MLRGLLLYNKPSSSTLEEKQGILLLAEIPPVFMIGLDDWIKKMVYYLGCIEGKGGL